MKGLGGFQYEDNDPDLEKELAQEKVESEGEYSIIPQMDVADSIEFVCGLRSWIVGSRQYRIDGKLTPLEVQGVIHALETQNEKLRGLYERR